MAAHGLTSAVKLASNESPFGPLPGVPDAVAAATGDSGRYPDHLAETAARGRWPPVTASHAGQVAVGCGSVGLLQQLLLSFAGPGRRGALPVAVVHRLPPVHPAGRGHRREAPLTAWATDVDALLGARSRPARRWSCSPTRTTRPAPRCATAALTRLVDALPPTVLLVVDEAYREYVTDPDVPDALELLRRPAQRRRAAGRSRRRGRWPACGSATSSAIRSVVDAADATLTPFSVSAPAQAAALAALEQGEEVARRAAVVVAERARVSSERWPAVACPCPTAKATSCGCPPAPAERRRWRRPWSAGAWSPGRSPAASG